MLPRNLCSIGVAFLLSGCGNDDSSELGGETEFATPAEWPGLDRAQWREVILSFYSYGAPYDYDRHSESLVQGDPVSDQKLDELEERIGLPLPTEFRQFYGNQNGFGLKREGGAIDWVFVPIGDIPALTAMTRGWIQKRHPELAPRVLAFVDWDDGESVGFLLSESGTPLRGVSSFMRDHDKTPRCGGETGIYNLLTEPNVPPRFFAKKNLGESGPRD